MASRCPWSRQEVVVVVLCCLTTAALSTQQQQQFLQEPELAGVLLSTHWLFHMAHTSKLNCAAVCGQQSRCHAFTFIGSRTGRVTGSARRRTKRAKAPWLMGQGPTSNLVTSTAERQSAKKRGSMREKRRESREGR